MNITTGNVLAGAGIFFGAILALNVWTFVPVGEKKVEVCIGKVTGVELSNGLHGAKPWCSYDGMNTQFQMLVLTNTLLPTQDRMNNTGDVTIKYRLKDIGLSDIRNDYGSEQRFLNKTLFTDAPDAIKAEARKLKDSSMLANNKHIEAIKSGTIRTLTEKLGDQIDIREILINGIVYDEAVRKQILATKVRQEQEKRETSNLEIEKTKLKKGVEAALAKSLSAEHNKTAAKAVTDATFYAAQKEADAMKLRGESLRKNPGLIAYMEAEANLINAKAELQWDGKRTLTHNIIAMPITPLK